MGERNLIMTGVVRQGDANVLGGVCLNGVASVLVNGRPVAVPAMIVTPHPTCGTPGGFMHCIAVTKGGNRTVLAEGKPIIIVGESDTCGHSRATGSTDVKIG
jgi:uncharacterized Zn-binding protein involved in type VI secretion